MNDNKKTYKHCHVPNYEHKSSLYKKHGISCRLGTIGRGHQSQGAVKDMYRRILKAKMKEEERQIINESLQE